jgi:uncharacterized protein YpbB
MDSLDWSKKYEVFSISRLFLQDQLGFTTEQIQQLLEEDMFYIADVVRDSMLHGLVHDFDEEVRFVTRTVLSEKLSGGQDG